MPRAPLRGVQPCVERGGCIAQLVRAAEWPPAPWLEAAVENAQGLRGRPVCVTVAHRL